MIVNVPAQQLKKSNIGNMDIRLQISKHAHKAYQENFGIRKAISTTIRYVFLVCGTWL